LRMRVAGGWYRIAVHIIERRGIFRDARLTAAMAIGSAELLDQMRCRFKERRDRAA
jgi:hypothetical protein